MKGAQQKAADAPPQQQMVVLKQTTYVQFFMGEVVSQPDGSMVLQFIVPNGEVHVFPLAAEAAEVLGKQLLAPRVQVARPGDVPPPPGGVMH